MRRRGRLLGGAAALLYLGPLLAGLAGHPLSVAPAFALLFLMWLALLRPGLWPATAAGWLRPAPWLALLGRMMVQVVLVLLCLGLGRLVALAGLAPALPLWLPLVPSALALPLARLVWNPDRAEAMDRFVTDATEQVERLTEEAQKHD